MVPQGTQTQRKTEHLLNCEKMDRGLLINNEVFFKNVFVYAKETHRYIEGVRFCVVMNRN